MQYLTPRRGFLLCTLYNLLFCTPLIQSAIVCDRCLLGTYNAASVNANCTDMCHTSDCNACDASDLPRFALWGPGCNVIGCKRGFVMMKDATNSTVCSKILDGRIHTSSDDSFLAVKDINGISDPWWPPSLAYDFHTSKSRSVAKTGSRPSPRRPP
jgi:hypothetical protein